MTDRDRSGNELEITRVFDAPRELVWKAWTECEWSTRWWGAKGVTSPVCKMDLRVGGEYLNCMRLPDGQDVWSRGVYREIVAPERLVMTDSFADEAGNTVPGSHYGMGEDFPLEMLIAVTFEEQDGRTKLTLTHSGTDGIGATERDMMQQGWSESFDKLAASLEDAGEGIKVAESRSETHISASPGEREIVITRVFDAARESVFRTLTDPKLIPRWWGPRRLTTTVDKMDVRPGGVWRFVQREPDGSEYAFNGVYREVVPPERIVQTFEFEGMPGHVSVETATLEERDGKTKLTTTSVFETVEDRDGMLQSGMEEGVVETMDRLAELLQERTRQT